MSPRTADIDPLFDNTALNLTGNVSEKQARIVPYTIEQTYAASNGSRQDFLEETSTLSAMQRHVVFFDADCDGIIWPCDTFRAFLTLGYGVLLACISVFLIHGAFSYPTGPTSGNRPWHYLPDPFFRIYVANIQRCKHGTDSDSFDRRGRIDSTALQAVFDDYSSAEDKDSLSYADVLAMIRGRRHLMDPIGVLSEIFEFTAMYILLWPNNGRMRRSDIELVLDGSIFVVLAYQRRGAFFVK